MKKIFKKVISYMCTSIALLKVGTYVTRPKVNFLSRFSSNTHLGSNTHFNGMTIKGNGKVNIGDNFHSGQKCLLITSFHDFDSGDSIPYDSKKYIHKNVNIGSNVWIGDRVIILGGVCLGDGVIIQAGSVVVSDIPKFGIAGGSPAKVFKYRDAQHYEKLVNENKVI